MAKSKPSTSDEYSDEAPSNGSASESEDRKSDAAEEEDEEELEAVARTATSDDEEQGEDNSEGTEDDEGADDASDDEVGRKWISGFSPFFLSLLGVGWGCTQRHGFHFAQNGNPVANTEVGRKERARLKEMQRLKKQKVHEILEAQNASIDADMVGSLVFNHLK